MVAAGVARCLVWAGARAARTAAPAAALGPAPPEDVSRLWSRYPAGEQRVQMSPGPAPPAQPEPAVQPNVPRPGAADTSAPAELTRAPAASQTPSPSPDRQPWLLGAGVGIALGMGLLVLLVLGRLALSARRRGRKPAAAATTADTGSPSAPPPRESAAPPSPSTPSAPRPQVGSAGQNGAAPAVTHLLLVPTPDGYSLIQSRGEAPDPGTSVDGAALPLEGAFVVARVGPSPLPADRRRCAYLERTDA